MMFDIKDSKNIILDSNKTSNDTFAKIENVEGLKAKNNEASLNVKTSNEDIVEIKPNFMGIGINFNAFWRWLRN